MLPGERVRLHTAYGEALSADPTLLDDDGSVAATLAHRSALRFRLTDRESEVLALVAEGHTNGQIASTLFISPKTASVHVSNILAKLGVSTRTEAATAAHRHGLLPTT